MIPCVLRRQLHSLLMRCGELVLLWELFIYLCGRLCGGEILTISLLIRERWSMMNECKLYRK